MSEILCSVFHFSVFACIILVGLMSLAWGLSVRIKNAGLVDVVWPFSFFVLLLLSLCLGQGLGARKALLFCLVAPWSISLGLHLVKRFCREFPREDKRYAAWRAEWLSNANRNMFVLFQFQGVLILLLSIPFIIASSDQSQLRSTDIAGCLIAGSALVGEIVADAQLASFKADNKNQGKVCSEGLWNYSRHPNYFFEWMIWVGLFVFVSRSPGGWLTIYCPILMLFMLTKVSGVKLTEWHALRDRGSDYLQYQKSTSAFFPWFKTRRI